MRIKLSEQYPKEREDICNRLLTILDLKEDNTFLLCDLDEDILKQEKILAMKEEIQKYFACSEISALKHQYECKNIYLHLIRGIVKKNGYSIYGKVFYKKYENEESKKTIKYEIFRRKSFLGLK